MWNRVVASLGKALEQRAEKRSGWNHAENEPKLELCVSRQAHPSDQGMPGS